MTSKKVHINISNKYDRVVVLVDMDCFYCQVEEKLNPALVGKPMAVVQYNKWQGGGIIAVNYLARAEGVTRHMRGDEAKEQCPNIKLVSVPSIRDKADLTKYRDAGKEVAIILQSYTPLLERASVDEAYLDITENVSKRINEMNKGLFQLMPNELTNTFAVGYDNIGDFIQEISLKVKTYPDSGDFNFEYSEEDIPAIQKSDLKLLIGASIVNEIRAKVKEKTGYDCSAGIAHNKILAKLACGINKPNKQTILPLRQIEQLFNTLPIGKIKGLGGKFGEDVSENLKVKFVSDLQQYTESELQRKFDDKNGSWLYLIARGIDLEAVTPRFYSKSIGCCKKFPGKNSITGINTLNHWLLELSKEICDRMEKDELENNRKAKQMVVSYIQEINGVDVSSSRSTNMINMITNEPDLMAKNALDVIKKNTDQFYKENSENVLNNPLKFLGISVGKFESIETKQNTLEKMFMNYSKKKQKNEQTNEFVLSSVSSTNTATTTISIVSTTATNTTAATQIQESLSYVKNNDMKSVGKDFFTPHLIKQNELKIDDDNKGKNDFQLNKKEIKSFFINSVNKANNDNYNNSNTNNEVNGKIENESNTELSYQCNEVIASSFANDITENSPHKQNIIENTENNSVESISNNKQVSPVVEDKVSNLITYNLIPSTSKQCTEENNNLNDKNLDYMKNYAEFAIPEPNIDDYINCEKCGKKILSYTLQTHMDFHFAFELSQEQRENYRQEIKSKIKSPPAKKLKISSLTSTGRSKINSSGGNSGSSSNSNRSSSSIDKFFMKKQEQNIIFNHSVKKNNEQKELCSECGVQISIEKILEHQDYHIAKRLQAEINRSLMQEQSSAKGERKENRLAEYTSS